MDRGSLQQRNRREIQNVCKARNGNLNGSSVREFQEPV